MASCYNSTVIASPIEKVWEIIKNFHELPWAYAVITKVEVVGDKAGTEVGAKRILNDAFHETLIAWNEDEYTFSYSIDDGPEPVSKSSVTNYVGVVKLRPVTDANGTFIEWRSSYEAAMENEVADFCNPVYAGLLASLKASLK